MSYLVSWLVSLLHILNWFTKKNGASRRTGRTIHKGADTLDKHGRNTRNTQPTSYKQQINPKTRKRKENKNTQQKMLMSLFIHEGFAGTKRRRRRRIACDGKRPQRVIILPWLFFFSPVPGQNGSSRSLRDCALHICLDTATQTTNHLSVFLSLPAASLRAAAAAEREKNARKQKSLSSSSSPCPCCKFGSHPTRCCRAPFTNHLQYISHRWSKMIFCQAICSESLTHIGPLPFDDSCSRIFSRPHTTDVVGRFIFIFFNWFRTSILTMFLFGFRL